MPKTQSLSARKLQPGQIVLFFSPASLHQCETVHANLNDALLFRAGLVEKALGTKWHSQMLVAVDSVSAT